MPSVSASIGPLSGPILPPCQKGGDLTTFLGGCGAKLWGSGGAPPTNLILLRNQRPEAERRRNRRHAHAGPVRGAFGDRLVVVRRLFVRRSRPPTHSSQAPNPPRAPSLYSPPSVEWFGWRVVAITARVGVDLASNAWNVLPPSTRATTAALRFAPDTVAEGWMVPAIATILLRNPRWPLPLSLLRRPSITPSW